VVDRRDGLHAGIVGSVVVAVWLVLLVPVEDASDEGRDEGGFGFGGSDCLMKSKEQRHVAVDTLLLEDFGGANAFPGGGQLDENAIAGDACLVVQSDDRVRLVDRLVG